MNTTAAPRAFSLYTYTAMGNLRKLQGSFLTAAAAETAAVTYGKGTDAVGYYSTGFALGAGGPIVGPDFTID